MGLETERWRRPVARKSHDGRSHDQMNPNNRQEIEDSHRSWKRRFGVFGNNSVEELPNDRGDLAVFWVHPTTASAAVDLAHQAGCKRIWFSFWTGHRDAVAKARELGMEVVEIGRCPVLYLDDKPAPCKAHTLVTKVTGAYGKPPQTDPNAKRREMY